MADETKKTRAPKKSAHERKLGTAGATVYLKESRYWMNFVDPLTGKRVRMACVKEGDKVATPFKREAQEIANAEYAKRLAARGQGRTGTDMSFRGLLPEYIQFLWRRHETQGLKKKYVQTLVKDLLFVAKVLPDFEGSQDLGLFNADHVEKLALELAKLPRVDSRIMKHEDRQLWRNEKTPAEVRAQLEERYAQLPTIRVVLRTCTAMSGMITWLTARYVPADKRAPNPFDGHPIYMNAETGRPDTHFLALRQMATLLNQAKAEPATLKTLGNYEYSMMAAYTGARPIELLGAYDDKGVLQYGVGHEDLDFENKVIRIKSSQKGENAKKKRNPLLRAAASEQLRPEHVEAEYRYVPMWPALEEALKNYVGVKQKWTLLFPSYEWVRDKKGPCTPRKNPPREWLKSLADRAGIDLGEENELVPYIFRHTWFSVRSRMTQKIGEARIPIDPRQVQREGGHNPDPVDRAKKGESTMERVYQKAIAMPSIELDVLDYDLLAAAEEAEYGLGRPNKEVYALRLAAFTGASGREYVMNQMRHIEQARAQRLQQLQRPA